MTTAYEVPLTTGAQRLSIKLDDVEYQMRLRFVSPGGYWGLDIYDSSGSLLVGGLALVTGTDLLGQHRHLGFTGALIVQTDHDADAVPDYSTLGVTGRLYYLPDADNALPSTTGYQTSVSVDGSVVVPDRTIEPVTPKPGGGSSA